MNEGTDAATSRESWDPGCARTERTRRVMFPVPSVEIGIVLGGIQREIIISLGKSKS